MAMTLDLRRQPFGKWLVLYKGQQTAHGQFWVCQCACNPAVTVELVEDALVEGWTRSCGCDYVGADGIRRSRRDLVGRQFGKRLVVRFHRYGTAKPWSVYTCRCLCGAEGFVRPGDVEKKTQCLSCAMRKPLAGRWYGDVFVEGVVGAQGQRGHTHALYQVRFADGSSHQVRGSKIRSGDIKGVGHQNNDGTVRANLDQVLAWVRDGVSCEKISRRLGLYKSCVRKFLQRHPEYHTLPATVPRNALRGTVATHIDQVMVWLRAGVPMTEMSRRLGVGRSAVEHFLHHHPEIRVLVASLPPDETLISEVS